MDRFKCVISTFGDRLRGMLKVSVNIAVAIFRVNVLRMGVFGNLI
jgi:hypothetical protein